MTQPLDRGRCLFVVSSEISEDRWTTIQIPSVFFGNAANRAAKIAMFPFSAIFSRRRMSLPYFGLL